MRKKTKNIIVTLITTNKQQKKIQKHTQALWLLKCKTKL